MMAANFIQRPVVFGEILFDHFPDGSSVLGGAPFNVAWHLQAFGAKPVMISSVGDDREGKEILNAMKLWGMSTSAVQIDKLHPTGSVKVEIRDGEPEYDITLNCAYDHVNWTVLPEPPTNPLLYHGTLALRDASNRSGLRTLKDAQPWDCFLDINLRSPFWSPEILADSVYKVRVLKLNLSELEMLGEVFSMPGKPADIDRLMQATLKQFELDQLVVTRGPEGALALTSTDKRPIAAKPVSATSVVDTVGAGDAFSSVLVLGRCLQWPLQLTLTRAQSFAAEVVGLRGATTNDESFYRPFKTEWRLD